MPRTDATPAAAATAPTIASPPVTKIWRTIRDYVLWSYERGSIPYDVMVTLILCFVFFSPHWINFKDKPMQIDPHRTEVVVIPDGEDGLIFRVDGSVVQGNQDSEIRTQLSKIIRPISGEVDITRYEAERDRWGQVLTYKVWARKK